MTESNLKSRKKELNREDKIKMERNVSKMKELKSTLKVRDGVIEAGDTVCYDVRIGRGKIVRK